MLSYTRTLVLAAALTLGSAAACNDAAFLTEVPADFVGPANFYQNQSDALAAVNGAYAAFEEGNRGSLKPGKYADITVLSKDILNVPEEEILSAKVSYTIVGGKVVFKGK